MSIKSIYLCDESSHTYGDVFGGTTPGRQKLLETFATAFTQYMGRAISVKYDLTHQDLEQMGYKAYNGNLYDDLCREYDKDSSNPNKPHLRDWVND